MLLPEVPSEIEIAYPCLAIHMSLLLQKELHHLDVAVVTGHMKGCVAHLRHGERDSWLLFSSFITLRQLGSCVNSYKHEQAKF